MFGGNNSFGAIQNKPATAAGGLFGQPAAAPAPAAGGFSLGGSFGGAQTGGGLFGSTTNQQQNQQQQSQPGAGLFGAASKPAGGLFGSAQQPGNTFGATGSTGGLFSGQQQTQNTGSIFGLSQQPLQQQSQAQQSQGPQLAAVSSDPYGSSGFFSIPTTVSTSNGKNAGELFGFSGPQAPKSLPPLSSSLRGTPNLGRSGAKLRGFANPQTSNTPRAGLLSSSGLGLSVSTSTGNLFDAPSSAVLDPNAFTPRHSVKKLVLQKKVTGSDLQASQRHRVQGDRSHLLLDGDAESTLGGSVAGLDDEARGSPAPRRASGAVSLLATKRTGSKLNQIERDIDLNTLKEDEYYTIPAMPELANASFEDLKNVEEFVVGRKGWGELRYLESVNLNEVPNLRDIMGHLVLFERPMECEVYPDGSDRREPGSGLNHRAQITLERCWPKDRSTGNYVKDPQDPRMKKMERKVRSMPGTEFMSFNPGAGRVIFTVEHFTKYGLADDDDDLEMDDGAGPLAEDAEPAKKQKPSRDDDDMPPSQSIYFDGAAAINHDMDNTEEDEDFDEEEYSGTREDEASNGDFHLRESGRSYTATEDDEYGSIDDRRSSNNSGIDHVRVPKAVLPFNKGAVELMRQSLFSQLDATPALTKRTTLFNAFHASPSAAPHFPEAGRVHSGLLGSVPAKVRG